MLGKDIIMGKRFKEGHPAREKWNKSEGSAEWRATAHQRLDWLPLQGRGLRLWTAGFGIELNWKFYFVTIVYKLQKKTCYIIWISHLYKYT